MVYYIRFVDISKVDGLLHQINLTISSYFLLLMPCALIFYQHYSVLRKDETRSERETNVDSRIGTVGTRQSETIEDDPDLSAEFEHGTIVENLSRVDVEDYNEYDEDPEIEQEVIKMNGLMTKINVSQLKGKSNNPVFSRQTYAPSTQASLLDADRQEDDLRFTFMPNFALND